LPTGGGGASVSGSVFYISGLQEHKSASTTGYFSSTWQTLTGRHTAGIECTVIPYTYSGTPPSNVSSYVCNQSVYVEQGTEVSVPSGTSMGTSTPTAGVTAYGGLVSSGNKFIIQTSDTSTIPSDRHLAYWVKTDVTIHYNDGTPTYNNTSWGRSEYVLAKLTCYDASVDTRRTYGQPNKAGEQPGDPNAPLRSVNFGSWDFKGGVFLGNMPTLGADHSGTARTQLYVQGGSTYSSTYLFAALSLFDEGKPNDSSISGAIDAGIYFPSSSDTNLSVGEGDVTWPTQWQSITPGAVSSTSTDYTQHPYYDITLTDGNSNDYAVFQLTKVGGTKPSMALSNICLAIVDEATTVSYSFQCWHYFASREFQNTSSAFPKNDCAPRVWLIYPA